MRLVSTLIIFAAVLVLAACGTSKRAQQTGTSDLQELKSMMTGSFNSSAQAQQDTNYYDITLHMYPIWEDKEGEWLYVEQAVTRMQDKPYRQRIYKLEATPGNIYKSYVFTLKEPKKYIGAWKEENGFADFSMSDIELKEGCEVVMSKDKNDMFKGKTGKKTCPSSLRGASYATSEVRVLPDRIVSWDQGWDAEGKQVWGATLGGYEFLKVKK